MTIYEIKRRTAETEPYFFSRASMRFFHQTLKDFKVYKINERFYLFEAPFGPREKRLGKTQYIFDSETDTVQGVKREIDLEWIKLKRPIYKYFAWGVKSK
jgi:hypothetical protein